MRPCSGSGGTPSGPLGLLSALLSLSTLAGAITLDCSKVVDQGVKWDLSKLEGPRQVHELARQGPQHDIVRNVTYTIDLCRALVKGRDSCTGGTRICAQERLYYRETKPDPPPEDVWPIAGEGTHTHGRHLEPTPTRLKDSQSGADAEREGVRISFAGGMHEGVEGRGDVRQKAYVELICDTAWTGLEVAKPPAAGRRRRRDGGQGEGGSGDGESSDEGEGDDDDDDDGEAPAPLPNPDEGSALQFVSYRDADEKGEQVGVLRLEWRTKYACEDAADAPDDGVTAPGGKSGGGMGFFAWFIVILFLGISTYLIFGAWLNYTRYGARGWDLLPHGDTVRDVPYLLKDWARRVFGGSRGGIGLGAGNDSNSGTRGGYSAI